MKNYTVETMVEGRRYFINFTEKNRKGETLVIELTKCEDDPNYKKSLPKMWEKSGYIDRVLTSYWSVSTYVTDTENGCRGDYNPQHKLSEDGRRYVINFDWMSEATADYAEKLVKEIYRQFSEATGETATEKKNRQIEEYAKNKNIQLLKSIPDGWKKTGYNGYMGLAWISNGETFRSGKREEALLFI